MVVLGGSTFSASAVASSCCRFSACAWHSSTLVHLGLSVLLLGGGGATPFTSARAAPPFNKGPPSMTNDCTVRRIRRLVVLPPTDDPSSPRNVVSPGRPSSSALEIIGRSGLATRSDDVWTNPETCTQTNDRVKIFMGLKTTMQPSKQDSYKITFVILVAILSSPMKQDRLHDASLRIFFSELRNQPIVRNQICSQSQLKSRKWCIITS